MCRHHSVMSHYVVTSHWECQPSFLSLQCCLRPKLEASLCPSVAGARMKKNEAYCWLSATETEYQLTDLTRKLRSTMEVFHSYHDHLCLSAIELQRTSLHDCDSWPLERCMLLLLLLPLSNSAQWCTIECDRATSCRLQKLENLRVFAGWLYDRRGWIILQYCQSSCPELPMSICKVYTTVFNTGIIFSSSLVIISLK